MRKVLFAVGWLRKLNTHGALNAQDSRQASGLRLLRPTTTASGQPLQRQTTPLETSQETSLKQTNLSVFPPVLFFANPDAIQILADTATPTIAPNCGR